MAIKYISSATDGTGDYIADGSGDQDVINNALLNNQGNEIHLVGPFSYDLESTVRIGSNTIFSGDPTAILRLNDSCMWASGVPVIGQIGGTGTITTNVEICGFQIDCNEKNLVHIGVGDPERKWGKGYYNAIGIQGQSTNHASGINIHNLKIYNSMGDGPRLTYCTDIIVRDCEMWNLGHCSVFCVDSTNIKVYNNNIQAITCSGIRVDHCQDWDIYSNNIRDWTGTTHAVKSGEYGVQVGMQPESFGHTTLTKNGRIFDNTINVGGSGIQIEDYLQSAGTTPQNVEIYNNAIRGGSTGANYFAGITIYSWGNGLTIRKNTIGGSARAGILGYSAIASGVTVLVKDNNIINTIKAGSDGGYGFWNKVPTQMTIVAENNYLYGNIAGKYMGVTPSSESTNIITDAVPGDTPQTPDEPDAPDEPVLPIANFTADVASGYAPLTVTFTNLSKNATEWIWDFGDGGTSTENNPVYTYLTSGTYTVKLTATNADGTASKLAIITVSDVDDPLPTEPDDPPYSGYQGIMMPSGDGHYIFRLLSIPSIGDSVLLFPIPGDDYSLLKLNKNVTVGSQITIVPDGKGNYYAIK